MADMLIVSAQQLADNSHSSQIDVSPTQIDKLCDMHKQQGFSGFKNVFYLNYQRIASNQKTKISVGIGKDGKRKVMELLLGVIVTMHHIE